MHDSVKSMYESYVSGLTSTDIADERLAASVQAWIGRARGVAEASGDQTAFVMGLTNVGLIAEYTSLVTRIVPGVGAAVAEASLAGGGATASGQVAGVAAVQARNVVEDVAYGVVESVFSPLNQHIDHFGPLAGHLTDPATSAAESAAKQAADKGLDATAKASKGLFSRLFRTK